jgi:alanyl-tRNA synthetase
MRCFFDKLIAELKYFTIIGAVMDARTIRNLYLDYLTQRGHVVIPRASIVPIGDPTTLFTNSGMQPLVPYLLGEKHQNGSRLVDSQTCLRSGDIEEVGDNRHTTFFEMLGNWSLGDYFKQDQLTWFWTFLIEVVGLDPKRLYATACSGFAEYGVPKDSETATILSEIFKKAGIVDPKQLEVGSEQNGYMIGDMVDGVRAKIFFYDKKNWWSRNGPPADVKVGEPCGPDSEVFYLFDEIEHDPIWGVNCHPNCDCGRYMEIGNSVFMEYIRTEAGFEKLPAQNVDFGGGLERIAAAKIDSPDVFKISLLWPIIESLQHISGKKYVDNVQSMRVIADHLRAATFLAVDGISPSNKEQGYVMRRLMRRAIRYAFDLGIEQNFIETIVPVIADLYVQDYPEVAQKRLEVIAILAREEKAFRQTLRKGIVQFSKEVKIFAFKGDLNNVRVGAYPISTNALDPNNPEKHQVIELEKRILTGQAIFNLHDTYGFPLELSLEEAKKQNIPLSKDWKLGFEKCMNLQKLRSQTAAKGTFKGGLGGQTLQHKKYHTATHLMYQALRQVLGDHVIQRGSNITEERLRFDFSQPEKVTAEQLAEVESIVNEQIAKDLKVSYAEYPTKVAREDLGALGQFGDRYGETVKVYKMIADGTETPFSFEICGGPHVDNTLQLYEDGKKFKILKEEASSAGIRRIKAVLV